MTLRRKLLATAALLASASVLPATAPALAQEAGASDGEGREVITVTARRREESILDVPIAVTAISGEQLEQTGAVDITAVQRLTPNATIEVARGSNSTLIAFIRGVGQQDPLWGFEPGVGLYIDDVYVARPQGAILDIFDVSSIEVLRGPQGTLYGRNTIGGAIKYVTNRLNTEEPEFEARVALGSYNQFDTVLTGSVPLSDTFAVGGSLARYTRDGFGENLFTGVDHYNKDIIAGRLSAEWAPADNLFVRLSYDRSEDDSNAKHGHRLIPDAAGLFPVTSDVFDTRGGAGDQNSVETEGWSATVEWDINDAFTFKSITAYREGQTVTPIDFDALPQPDFDVPANYADDQFSQEFQLLYNGDRLSGIVGAYYLDGNANGDFDVILGALGLTIYQAGDQTKENVSVYADFTYDVTDRLSVSAGARYTEDETVADVTREVWLGLGSGSFDAANNSIFLATQTGYQGLTRSDDAFTPRFSLSYALTDEVNVYASYSQGFKAGGFDPRARQDLDPIGLSADGFGPEFVDSYEIGAKGSLFDDRLVGSVAYFMADYTDQQITVQQGVDSDNDGINDTFVSSVFNAGESEYRGLEVEASLFLTDNFQLDWVMGIIDAEITEILSGGQNIASGFVTQNTPELTNRFGFTYNTTVMNDANLVVTGSASYRDGYNLFNVENDGFAPNTSAIFPAGGPALDPDSYALLDLSAVLTSANDRWTVAVHGRNLSDENYRVAAYNFVTPSQLGADGAYSAFYGAPRTFTASLTFRY